MKTIARFASLPIRTQLILLAVLLTLPALGIIIYSGLKVRAEDYRDGAVETQRLTNNVTAEIQRLIHESERLGALLSDLPDVRERNVAKVQSLLITTIKRYPGYNAILVADADGKVWASTVPTTTTIEERLYFRNVRATRRFSSGEFVLTKERGTPTIHVAYPLVEGQQFKGAIIMAFKLDMLREVLDRAQLSERANYVVTDHRGIIISRGRDIGQEVSKPIQKPDLQKMEKGPDTGTYEFSRMDGERRIVSYRKIRLEGEQDPFMYVRAGIAITDAVARANRHLLYNVSLMLSLVTLSLVLTFFIGKRAIVDRIAVLKRASQDVARGTLEIKVSDTVAGGELGDLGQAFDHMAQQLARREQALRESELSYRDIFNTTQDAVFVHDEAGRIVNINIAAEFLFGYTRDELLGLSVKELMSGVPPYTFQEARVLIRKSLDGEPQRFEWSGKKKSGELFWAEIALAATTIAGERRVLSFVRDITKSKEIERLKEEMISNVTHEMRTPLTAMLGFLEFVKENQVDEPQLKEYLGIVHKEAERLNEMVTNFLNMQRLKANLQIYTFQPVDVPTLVKEATVLFASPPHQDRVITQLPPGLPHIRGDETFLHQAIVNLLSNAIKYSPEERSVTVQARVDEDSVILSVRDRGVGIPEESLDKVFETFYRVKGTAKRPGAGLGLAFVKEIMRAHDGRVWVESTMGEGSTFYLSLPVVKPGQDRAGSRSSVG